MDKALSFDVSADFAMFRKGYTTTSALTYSIPPKTVVSGLIAAILGREWSNYYDTMSRSMISIGLLSPVRKMVIKENLMNTKKPKSFFTIPSGEGRARIPFEYLCNPGYRINFFIDGRPYDDLEQLLRNHEAHFTPYLGKADCLANISYRGEVRVAPSIALDSPVKINSAIPLDGVSVDDILIEQGRRYSMERVPISMNNRRVVTKFLDIAFETSGMPVSIKRGTYFKTEIGGEIENVLFF